MQPLFVIQSDEPGGLLFITNEDEECILDLNVDLRSSAIASLQCDQVRTLQRMLNIETARSRDFIETDRKSIDCFLSIIDESNEYIWPFSLLSQWYYKRDFQLFMGSVNQMLEADADAYSTQYMSLHHAISILKNYKNSIEEFAKDKECICDQELSAFILALSRSLEAVVYQVERLCVFYKVYFEKRRKLYHVLQTL